MDFTSDMGARSSSESSMVSSTYGDSVGGKYILYAKQFLFKSHFIFSSTADFDDDTEYLIRHEQKTSLR